MSLGQATTLQFSAAARRAQTLWESDPLAAAKQSVAQCNVERKRVWASPLHWWGWAALAVGVAGASYGAWRAVKHR